MLGHPSVRLPLPRAAPLHLMIADLRSYWGRLGCESLLKNGRLYLTDKFRCCSDPALGTEVLVGYAA